MQLEIIAATHQIRDVISEGGVGEETRQLVGDVMELKCVLLNEDEAMFSCVLKSGYIVCF